jgi:hypothetical protein
LSTEVWPAPAVPGPPPPVVWPQPANSASPVIEPSEKRSNSAQAPEASEFVPAERDGVAIERQANLPHVMCGAAAVSLRRSGQASRERSSSDKQPKGEHHPFIFAPLLSRAAPHSRSTPWVLYATSRQTGSAGGRCPGSTHPPCCSRRKPPLAQARLSRRLFLAGGFAGIDASARGNLDRAAHQLGTETRALKWSRHASSALLRSKGGISTELCQRLIELNRTRNDIQHAYPTMQARIVHGAVIELRTQFAAFMRTYAGWLRENIPG